MTTLEDIERHYADRIKAAGDDADQIAQLKTEKVDKVVELRMGQVQAREREIWRQAAIAEYPLSKDFVELVTGDTEDAIKASAKAAHERLEKLRGPQQGGGDNKQDDLKQQARDAYGRTAGGGNGQAVVYEDADENFLMNFQDRFNKGRDHPEFPTPSEVERFTRLRGSTHISGRVKHWAQQTRSVPV